MFGKLISFAIGMYAGIYADQHYKMPRVDNPTDLWAKIKEFVEEYKKENPGPKSD